MTTDRQSHWLYRAYDFGVTAGAIAIGYAFFVWLFGISETTTKFWVLGIFVAIPVINWLGESFMILPYATSLLKRRNVVMLMHKGFGRQRS